MHQLRKAYLRSQKRHRDSIIAQAVLVAQLRDEVRHLEEKLAAALRDLEAMTA